MRRADEGWQCCHGCAHGCLLLDVGRGVGSRYQFTTARPFVVRFTTTTVTDAVVVAAATAQSIQMCHGWWWLHVVVVVVVVVVVLNTGWGSSLGRNMMRRRVRCGMGLVRRDTSRSKRRSSNATTTTTTSCIGAMNGVVVNPRRCGMGRRLGFSRRRRRRRRRG